MTSQELANRALYNARTSNSPTNYPAIYSGFAKMGISEDQIQPRVNVLTYHAWHAVGRQVRKGEKGVRVVTMIPVERKDKETGAIISKSVKPRTTVVFHITQTDKTE